MRRNLIAALALVSLVASVDRRGAQAAGGAADFNGMWRIDAERSQQNPAADSARAAAAAELLQMTLNGERFVITAQAGVGQRQIISTQSYVLDGVLREFSSAIRGGGTGAYVANRSPDGSQILIAEDVTRATPDGTVTEHTTYTWILSADGQSLKLEIVTRSEQREVSTLRFYRRL